MEINTEARQQQLTGFITEIGKSALLSLWLGAGLILIGFGFMAISAQFNPTSIIYNNCSFPLGISNVSTFIIALLAQIAAVLLIMAYKNSIKQADIFRNELIALRDLGIALEICNQISTEDGDKTVAKGKGHTTTRQKSQKSKMEQSIIEAILNRCGK